MKKILITLSLLVAILSPASVLAQSIKVSSLQDFTTENPSQSLKVVTVERVEFKNGFILREGTIIKGEVFDVRPPMRGKLNATFKFKPLYYSYNGEMVKVSDEGFIAKYAPYKPLDKGELAISAASTAGSMFLKVPGFGQAVSFAKGVAKDPDNNRLKSGVTQIYKDSLFAYVEEGKEVNIAKDEMFVLKFKTKEEEAQEKDIVNDLQGEVPAANKTEQTIPVPATAENKDSTVQPVDPDAVLKEVEEELKLRSKSKKKK